MALHILRDIATFVHNAKFFSLMADEVTDVSNKEQVVCFRSVDEKLEPHENFVGIHNVNSIKADVLVATLKDTMLQMNLPLSNCRGQCDDGAANMCGARRGVASQISLDEHFLFTVMDML